MEVDINRAWEINPYDASAYGAIVVILLGAVMYLAKKLSEKEKEIKELYVKLHEITDVLGDKLNEIKSITEMRSERHLSIKEKIMYILEDIKNRLNKLEYGNR
jgi:hypothetical protein